MSDAERDPTPKTSRSPSPRRRIYAVRTGLKAGIYEHWHDALDAGFKQKEEYGNACKFVMNDRQKAEEWLNRPQLDENVLESGQTWLKRQTLPVRLMVLSVMTTLYGYIIFKISIFVNESMGCDDFSYPAAIQSFLVSSRFSLNCALLVFTSLSYSYTKYLDLYVVIYSIVRVFFTRLYADLVNLSLPYTH